MGVGGSLAGAALAAGASAAFLTGGGAGGRSGDGSGSSSFTLQQETAHVNPAATSVVAVIVAGVRYALTSAVLWLL